MQWRMEEVMAGASGLAQQGEQHKKVNATPCCASSTVLLPAALASRLPWLRIAPLGTPVVPLV